MPGTRSRATSVATWRAASSAWWIWGATGGYGTAVTSRCEGSVPTPTRGRGRGRGGRSPGRSPRRPRPRSARELHGEDEGAAGREAGRREGGGREGRRRRGRSGAPPEGQAHGGGGCGAHPLHL